MKFYIKQFAWLLLGLGLLFIPLQRTFSAIRYSADFESGIGTEWSATNLNNEVSDPFTSFSGRFGNDTQMLMASNLVEGASYSLFFDLYIIDSWDGGNDRFKVDVDGTNLFDHSFYYYNPPANQTYSKAPDVGPVDLGFSSNFDSIYRQIEVEFDAVSNTASIEFYGSGLGALSDESWGIDHVMIQDYKATEIEATSLPSGSSATAISWFSITAARVLVDAPAMDEANYDLRAAGVDGAFDTGDDILYTLIPTFDGHSTVRFTFGETVPLPYEKYRFQSSANLMDLFGKPLDAFSKEFVLQESITGRLEDLSNDSLDEADSLMPLTESPDPSGFLTTHGSGSFSSATDNDYWKFEAEAGDVITAWVDVERGDVQPYLNLYNATGTRLKNVNDWTWHSRIQNYTIAAGGTYYLMVDPYYERTPKPSYTLRLDVGRNRSMENEDNNTPAKANLLEWALDGHSLKTKSAGALVRSDDLFNLGFLNEGNAISVNVRFPAESTLDASNLSACIELADGTELYSTNVAVFAYDLNTNAVHYLRLHSDTGMSVLGQYVLDLTLLDSDAPLLDSSSLPMAGTTNTAIIDRFTVQFSECMDLNTVTNPASYRLSSSGVDGVWGNGDDEFYPLVPTYIENSLTADIGILQGPLQPNREYRFEANENLNDRLGNALGANYLQAFHMENLPGYSTENRNNNVAAWATPLGSASNMASGSFALLESMLIGDKPFDLEAVDLTGDTVLDLVCANFNSDQVQIMEGQGDGTFLILTNLVVGDGPRQTTVGYFNADDYPDLAVANEYSDSVSILLGQGGGMFAPKVDVATGDGPFDIAAGDLNGDGYVDLAVALNNAAKIHVLLGDGSGAFNSDTNYAVGSGPQEIEIADLNGDSKLDLAVVNYNSDTVSVFLNNGTGTLSDVAHYACGDTPRCLSMGDMDNDGHVDLVVGNFNADTISILLGNGTGTFGAPSAYAGPDGPADLSLKDISGDGFLDVLVASYSGNKFTTLLNAGDGTLVDSNHQYPAGYYPYSLVVADFDGDGLDDVVMAESYYDHLYIYRGTRWIELSEDPVGSGMCFGAGRGNIRNIEDVDYWSFSAKAGDQVVLAIQTPGNPTASRLDYYLLDSAGTRVGSVYDSNYYGGHGQSPPLTIPSEGTYTVVIDYDQQYWGEYRLRVTKVPEGQQLESESNNTIAEANLLDFAVNGERLENAISGYVGVPDLTGDFFSLGNLTAGTVIRLNQDQPSNSELDPLVEILFEDGNPVSLDSNQVLQLDGDATDYAMANPVAAFPTTALTYELWMRTTDTSKAGSLVSYASSSQYNEALLYNYKNLAPQINGTSYATGISANDGRWHHIAWTWDGITGTSLLYKDGDLVHSNGNFRTGYSLIGNGSIVLGQEQDSLGGGFTDGEAFLGIMDEVRVWNTVRSPAEIQSNLYNSLTGNEAGLVSYWNFDGLSANDQTVNANDLTLGGGARLLEAGLQGDPSAQPTSLEFTTTTNGIYYVRMADFAGEGDLLSQYQMGISLEDQTPPFVTGTSLPKAGRLTDANIDFFTISFSEEMSPLSVSNSANYDLRSAGVDGLFETADDEVYGLLPSYTSGLEASYALSDGPLQPGAIRLTVSAGLQDRMGRAMGSPYVQGFTNELRSGFMAENRDNDTAATATSLDASLSESPVGSGLFSAFGYGNIHNASDTDYWSFTAQAGDVVTVASEIPGHANSSRLTYYLYDPAGTQLAYFRGNSYGGYGQTPPITLASGGRYTVRVSQYSAYYDEYNIAVQVARPPLQPESELNNTVATADMPVFALNAGRAEAQVCGFANWGGVSDDYYGLGSLPSGTVVQVSMEFPENSELVPYLQMVDATGAILPVTTNQMLSLDGSSDYMRHATTGIDPRSGTVEGWVYPKESTDWGFWQTYDYSIYDRVDQISAFAWNNNPSTFYFRTGNGTSGVAQDLTFGTTNYIPSFTWSHLAFTWGGSNLNVYVNGSLIASRSDAVLQDVVNANACMGIGDRRWLNGWIDEFRIWDRPLSLAEVNTYKDQTLTGSESGLVSYWNFDGSTQDASANANHGELFNQAHLMDYEDPVNPSYPTNFTFTVPDSGAYYVRVATALDSAKVTSQYILNLSTYDSTIPYVASDTLPIGGTTNNVLFNTFAVTFSEEMDMASVTNLDHVALVGLSSSTAYTLAVDYTSGLTANFSITDGPLQPDDYRFVVSPNMTDRSGTALIAYTNEFTMAVADGYVLESRQNGDADPYTTLNGASTNLNDGTFSQADSLLVGGNPLDLASGLFDDDTYLDLVVANYASHTVSILTGTGTNTFNLSTNISVGSYPRAVSVGLINGDAHLDLAVASQGTETVSILLGDGSGNFTHVDAYAVGTNPDDVVLADFDGDGALDLATANPGNSTMSVLLGVGDGTFGLKTDYPIENQPERLTVTDLNSDGTNDLVVASRDDGTLHFYQGQGDGTFVNTTNRVVGSRIGTVLVADLNLDGFPDFASVDSANDCVAILMADGSGGFQSVKTYWTGDLPSDLYIRDLDGDSAPDLVVVNRTSDSLSVLYGDGYGQFSAPVVTSTADDPVALCLGDFNLDGNHEVAVAHYNNDTVRIYSPNFRALLPEASADGSVHQQHGYGTIDSASDVDNWTFFAAAGDQLVLGVDTADHSVYNNQNTYQIFDPAGTRILNMTSDHYGYGESLPMRLTMSGEYRLRVIPQDNYYAEYRFRVTTVSSPSIFETENNNSIVNADRPEFSASAGRLSAWMVGSIEGNDTYGDYFTLGNLGLGTKIDLQVEFPQSSTLLPALEIFDPSGTQVASGNPATSLTYTAVTNGDFTVRINDASSTRGLDALYRLQLMLSGSDAPTVESISLPDEGAQVDELIYSFDVVFSEAMDVDSATNAAHYKLVNAGSDEIFGTSDDENYDVEAANFDGGAMLTLNVEQAPLQPGLFQFTVAREVSDRMGDSMVLDVVRNFEISSPGNMVYEGRDNDTAATATALILVDDPDGLRTGGVRGALKDTTDQDYYSFTASTNEIFVMGIDQIEYANARSLSYRVVDASDNLIVALTSDYSIQRGQTAPFTVPANGTYYVHVSYNHDYRGEYQIRILAATAPRMLETETNDDIASANLLTTQAEGFTQSSSVAGYIAHPADNDYFEIGAVTNDMTILVGVRVPTNSILVPAISVYDASGNYMSEEGVTGDGSAEVRITASNRYFVVVRGAESTGGFGQDYVLDTEILPTGEVIIPNLRTTQVTVPTASGIVSGDSVSFSYTVKNEGSAATEGGAWLDRVVLSRNKIMGDSDDYPLGSYARAGNLDAGAAYTNQVSIDLPDGIDGPFYIVVYTDFGDQVDERLFEGDNAAASVATFAIALADYPDLRVEDLSISGSNEVGHVLSINWNTVNRGTAASGAIHERVRIIRTDTGEDLLNQIFPVSGPIAMNAIIPHSLSFTTTVGVAHQVIVTTDAANEIFEYSGNHAGGEQNTATGIKSVVNFYDVLISASPDAGGSVVGGGHWPAGSIITVHAHVNTNELPYAFVNWTTEWGAFQSAATNYTFLLTKDLTLRANFILPQFVLSASRQPEAGGSVYGAGSYDFASTNVLRAYPSPGYRFGHWSEAAVDLGSATSVTNVMETDHALTAWFEEINPYHDVVTSTDPLDVATVLGAGHYTNGTTAVFAAPHMPTNATSRFLFQRMELNGSYLTTAASYTNTFTTLQPTNMTVVARYTSQPIEPQVHMISRNLRDPVPATTNFAMGIIFDRSMDPMVEPLILFSNTVDQSSFLAASNGVWESTTTSNDTFSLTPISWGRGMDGDYMVHVSQGTDLYGEMMGVTNAVTIEVNSTPPDNPLFTVSSSNATSATLEWLDYAAPSDLEGFRLYRETHAFTSVENLAPVGFASASALSSDITGIELDTDYYIAAAAVDVAGNMDQSVTGLFVRVDSVVPPAVALVATGQGAADVQLSWNDYDTAGLFGLEGFEVYSETTDFADVAGLTPIASVDSFTKSLLLQDLDRRLNHYFAVVGYNGLGQRVTAVTTVLWSDPYAGLITNNLTIDGNYEIYQDMTVANDATLILAPGTTLRFSPGTGLRIDGTLVAEGMVFDPITLTSASASPNRGDWNGLELGPTASTSSLRHLWVMYGHGIKVDGCSPTASALSMQFNASSGLALVNEATLATEDLLAQYNAVGLMQSDTSILSVSNSIVLNNEINAHSTGTSPLLASHVWWGSTNAAEVAAGVQGSVSVSPYLVTEPLLTPAVDTLDGMHDVGSRTVAMKYACRIAESVRVSEDSSFEGAFFDDFVATNSVLLSEGGGNKMLYIQYRNVNGETNAPIALPLNYVTDGPTLEGFNLSEGQTLSRPYVVEASATSPLGVAVSEFYVDDVLVASTNGGTLKVLWDIRTEEDGLHRVKWVARDPQGAFSIQSHNLWVSPVPPPVPNWVAPGTGTVTSASSITISGTAEPGISVSITRNAVLVAETVAGQDGVFTVEDLPLTEGNNHLTASAHDLFGSGSSSRMVVCDTGNPETVVLESFEFDPQGGVYLEWRNKESGEVPTHYKVYGNTAPFSSASEAQGSVDAGETLYTVISDIPDAHYWFAVVGVDGAGNESELSNLLDVEYDTVPPAFTIGYNCSSPVGPGMVHIVLHASEELERTPDLLITPAGASGPVMLALEPTAPNTYEGDFNIFSYTKSGLAQVRVSSKDLAGNYFNDAPDGMELIIDTTAPSGRVETDPNTLVQVLSNVTVSVNLTLSERPKSGTEPQLMFNPPAGASIDVPLSGSGLNWSGLIPLNPLMGSGFCQFELLVFDSFGNRGTEIISGEMLEIYNTELPSAPSIPRLHNPASQKAGKISFVWDPVPEAETYNLYRLAGSNGIPNTVVAAHIETNSWTDLPPVDGVYRYALTALRRGAESGMSTIYTKYSDRTPPGAPSNVVLQLKPSSVDLTWEAPTEGEYPIRYNIYRNEQEIRSVSAISATHFKDYPPRGTSVYVVASADWLGNEAFSVTNEFVMNVPAVESFNVLLHEDQSPLLTWKTGDAEIVGVNLYRNGVKHNDQPLTETSLSDEQYTGGSLIEYALKSVNQSGDEGPARVAQVHRVDFGLSVNQDRDGFPLMNYFDRYTLGLTNQTVNSSFELGSVELRRTFAGGTPMEVSAVENQTINLNESLAVDIPMSSMSSADAQQVRARIIPAVNESGATVTYQRVFDFELAVPDPQMVEVSVTNQLVAGSLESFKVRLYNRSLVDMNVVLTRENGSALGDVYLALKNNQGDEVGRGSVSTALLEMQVTPDGRGYVEVVAGSYLDLWVEDLLVPVALAESGLVQVEAGALNIFHRIGEADELVSGPISASVVMSLSESPYFGSSATDSLSYANDETIVISGKAICRTDGHFVTNAPLQIGFAQDNFRWYEEVMTDENGAYSLSYQVPQGLSGTISIWAAHPDVADRLDQTMVRVYRLFCLPQNAEIRMSKNNTVDAEIALYNPGNEPLYDLLLSAEAYRMDGTNEIAISSISAQSLWDPMLELAAGEQVRVPFRIQSDVDAPDLAVIKLKFTTAERASATLTGVMTLLEPVPVVDVVEPSVGYVDLTLNRGKVVTRTVTIANHGVRDLKGVTMTPPATVDWMLPNLAVAHDGVIHLPDLPVGSSNTFDMVFMPPEDVEMDHYQDTLTISGTNHPGVFKINLYATVSSADKGSLQFYVQNTLSLPVPEASVRLSNRLLGIDLPALKTGPDGLLLVENLQEGYWNWRIDAAGHSTDAGLVEVMADQVNHVDKRLNKELVTVRFSVVPVPFTDRYEIKIEQLFETHVPMPVLVVDPMFQKFNTTSAGVNMRFNVTARNHGLIALNDFTIEGNSYDWGQLTPMITYLPRLNPQEEVLIPYMFVSYGTELDDALDQQSCPGGGGGSGGGGGGGGGGVSGAIANFGANLHAAISHLAGGAKCPGALDEATAHKIVAVLEVARAVLDTGKDPQSFAEGELKKLEEKIIKPVAEKIAEELSSGSKSRTSSGCGKPGNIERFATCFALGTEILMKEGDSLMVEELKVGDVVRCGPRSKDFAEIAEIITGRSIHWVELNFKGGQSLTVTDEHLIWLDGKGWTPAHQVKVGEYGFMPDGRRIMITHVSAFDQNRPLVSVRLHGEMALYASGILVHDQCGRWTPVVESNEGEGHE